jgi:hypothetical protein
LTQFGGRQAVVQAVLAQGMTAEMLGPVTSFIAQSSTGPTAASQG